ncbi:helix-turn-helix transcriptional regulator [Myceligenerans pegani]|uniref:Helix-turn-helix transcriptional regulator n=1 Tax=Myceligenerans pegani TaxID=2776917 RepID=A0ABR9MY76_9MICO|nr:helix-turn-helix transcriptional regulator [Myceligenerans sp. TRM 65318]MBE1876335.1 helix-turn-helix transcriptional regulator [Myceligenerans sp. TRM 65318]MBE3018606.1 helix-turn-helix transcriptional regulator [Myceligenerans sp. TRM 65318]
MTIEPREPADAVARAIQVLGYAVGRGAVDEKQVACGLDLELDEVRATLHELERDGLVVRRDDGPARPSAGGRWAALPPRSALTTLLAERRRDLAEWERHLDELAIAYRAAAGRDDDVRTEVLSSPEDVAAMYRHLLGSATREVLHLVKPPLLAPDPGATDPAAGTASHPDPMVPAIDPEADVRSVYDSETFMDPVSLETALQGRGTPTRLRLAPRVPFKLVVVDRQVAMLPAGGPDAGDTSIVVYAPALVGALAELFERVWDAAVPQELWRSHDLPLLGRGEQGDLAVPEYLPTRDAGAEPAERITLTPRSRSILDLMAGGLTDEAIGRALDISRRTVQSEVSHLAEQLGARTRFQIALLASEQGLVAARGRSPALS